MQIKLWICGLKILWVTKKIGEKLDGMLQKIGTELIEVLSAKNRYLDESIFCTLRFSDTNEYGDRNVL